MLYFNDINVKAFGQPFLANSLSLSAQNQEQKLRGIGEASQGNVYRNGIPIYSIQINYNPNIDFDPFINYVSNYTGYLDNFKPSSVLLDVGGISGNFVVERYGFNIPPNAVMNSSVELKNYLPVSGQITQDAVNLSYINDDTQIPSFWTISFDGSNPYEKLLKVLNMNYQCDMDYLVSYRLGSILPASIDVNKTTETVNFTCEYLKANNESSLFLADMLGKSVLVINKGNAASTDFSTNVRIDLSNFVLTNSVIEINTSDRIVSNLTFAREI